MAKATIRVLKNGPYEIRGEPSLTDRKGGKYRGQKDPLYLCRCGQSKNKPYCDGSHAETGFRAEESAEETVPKCRSFQARAESNRA